MFNVVLFSRLYKNVNVTTIMFLMSGDLTGLCLFMIQTYVNESQSQLEK